MLHPTRTTETRKRAVSCKTKTKQRRKKPLQPRNGNGKIKKAYDIKGIYFRGRGTR